MLTTVRCKSESCHKRWSSTNCDCGCGEKLEETTRDTSHHRLLALPRAIQVGRGADLVNLLVRIPEEAVLAYPQCVLSQDLKVSADVTDGNGWSCRRLFSTRFSWMHKYVERPSTAIFADVYVKASDTAETQT